jgi:hypothetical protein
MSIAGGFDLDVTAFVSALERKVSEINSGSNPAIEKALQSAGDAYMKFSRAWFDSNSENAWEPLSPNTMPGRHNKDADQILRDTWELYEDIFEYGPQNINQVVDNVWFGGTSNRKGMKHQIGGYSTWGGKGPARPILVYPPENVMEQIQSILGSSVVYVLSGV